MKPVTPTNQLSVGRKNSFREWAERSATLRAIAVAVLANIVWIVLLLNVSPAAEVLRLSSELELIPLDQRFSSTPTESYIYLEAIGAHGRAIYVPSLWIDMLTPIFVAATWFVALAYLTKRLCPQAIGLAGRC